MKFSIYSTLPIFSLGQLIPTDPRFELAKANFIADIKALMNLGKSVAPEDEQIERMNALFQNLLLEKLQDNSIFGKIHEIAGGEFAPLAVKHNLAQPADDDLAGFKSTNLDYNCDDEQCDVPLNLRGIWGYGCYCNFGNRLTQGKGSPVNKEDAICKRMQLCLRCAEMDARDGNYFCNARTTTYNSELGQSLPGQNSNQYSFNSGCMVQNPTDLCAAHVCTCEMQLINEFLELYWEGNTHDTAPRHPSNPYGGDFDYDANCFSNPGQTEIQCCGRYPFRYTFNALDKSCCEVTQEIYSDFQGQCCDSGVRPLADVC